MRKITNINGGWRFLKAAVPPETAMNWAARGEEVSLPHTWNAIDGQDGGNDYHRGTCWYVRELSEEECAGERLFLEVNGAAHTCEVFLNGEKIARHEGGAPLYEVVQPAALSAMPRPDMGDVFFDFEGDPLFSEARTSQALTNSGRFSLWVASTKISS